MFVGHQDMKRCDICKRLFEETFDSVQLSTLVHLLAPPPLHSTQPTPRMEEAPPLHPNPNRYQGRRREWRKTHRGHRIAVKPFIIRRTDAENQINYRRIGTRPIRMTTSIGWNSLKMTKQQFVSYFKHF